MTQTSACELDASYRIQPSALKDAGESLKVVINAYAICALTWQANEAYSSSEFRRPSVANGFSYEVTVAGQSGTKEPRWPTTIGLTVVDGSVTWTCRAAGSNALNTITSPSPVSDPVGLTISSVSVNEQCKILATYEGGVVDQDYDAVFNFVLDGVTRVARQVVKIRKR